MRRGRPRTCKKKQVKNESEGQGLPRRPKMASLPFQRHLEGRMGAAVGRSCICGKGKAEATTA
jgi:hypothetical protein